LKPAPKSADTEQGRAEERVHAFQRGGGPFVAAVEATRMPISSHPALVDLSSRTRGGRGSTQAVL
jgi:hypothetical protein